MADAAFVGLDLGTSGARAIAIDGEGAVVAQAMRPIAPPERSPEGGITQAPELWREAAFGVLAEVARKALGRIAAIAIDGTSGTLLLCDARGDPMGQARMYNDSSAAHLAPRIQEAAPPESGALAKAASGALERVPWVRVVNLARALEQIGEAGFWRIGLAGEAETELKDALGPPRVALVLGAEGPGMRQNTREHCDALARLPITDAIESLNVSNATAVALYAASVA